MFALATKIVSDYGKVLAQVEPGLHGLPESLLPHSRARIRDAIFMLLKNLEPEHSALKESLARGYVYLAQFVPDDDARILATLSASGADGKMANPSEPAVRLISQIKLDMERSLEEIQAFGPYTSPK